MAVDETVILLHPPLSLQDSRRRLGDGHAMSGCGCGVTRSTYERLSCARFCLT